MRHQLSGAESAVHSAKSRTESALSEAEARYNADLSAAGDRRLKLEAALSTVHAEQEAQVKDLTAQVMNAKSHIQSTEAELAEANANRTRLEVELEVAQAKIDDLEARLDGRASRGGRQRVRSSQGSVHGSSKHRSSMKANPKVAVTPGAYGGIKPLL